jgi:ubiquinone/menaquinone biosynthesis C-methylase UbiE
MNLIYSLLLSLTFFASQAQDPWKNVYTESAWADRDKWQKADELIRHLHLRPGSTVADVGCNEGYLTMKLAAAVGPSGKVFAVDVDQSRLGKLTEKIAKRNLPQVEVIKGDHDNPQLPVSQLDGVIILDTYHEMDDQDKILQHIRAALKPGGRLVLCEPIAEERKNSARSEQQRKHELSMNFALEDLRKAGFKILIQRDAFVDRVKEKGDTMWLIVAMK